MSDESDLTEWKLGLGNSAFEHRLESPPQHLGSAGSLAAPSIPSDSAGLPPAESFFCSHIMDLLGGRISIGNTQEGGWIAVQMEVAGQSMRVVLDENQIDQLILALAHVS
jgi:hypothetical protein